MLDKPWNICKLNYLEYNQQWFGFSQDHDDFLVENKLSKILIKNCFKYLHLPVLRVKFHVKFYL